MLIRTYDWVDYENVCDRLLEIAHQSPSREAFVSKTMTQVEQFLKTDTSFSDCLHTSIDGNIEIYHVPRRFPRLELGVLAMLVLVDHSDRSFRISNVFPEDKLPPEAAELKALVDKIVGAYEGSVNENG
jgi:hypothetical protein